MHVSKRARRSEHSFTFRGGIMQRSAPTDKFSRAVGWRGSRIDYDVIANQIEWIVAWAPNARVVLVMPALREAQMVLSKLPRHLGNMVCVRDDPHLHRLVYENTKDKNDTRVVQIVGDHGRVPRDATHGVMTRCELPPAPPGYMRSRV